MLFDLNSSPKRKRVVQIVFGGLALLFAVSFVGFGIGSDASGGIFDALGLSSDDSGTDNPEFESRIEDAEAALATNPDDEKALIELATVSALAGSSEAETDEQTGALILTQATEDFYADAMDAWETYLDLDPKKPDDGTAAQLLNVYITSLDAALSSADTSTTDLENLLDPAVRTASVFAEAQPSVNTYSTVTQLAYLSGDTELGDEAARLMIENADASERKSTEKLADSYAESGAAFQKSLAKAEEEQQTSPEEAFQNPLQDSLGGGLSGGGLTAPPPASP